MSPHLIYSRLHLEQTFTVPTPSKHNHFPSLRSLPWIRQTAYSLHVCEVTERGFLTVLGRVT